MLGDHLRSCLHPPISPSNVAHLDLQANWMWVPRFKQNRLEDRWNSSLLAASLESSAQPFTGTLLTKPSAGFQEFGQKQWRLNSMTNDFIAMEPFAAATADEHLPQVQDEDTMRLQSGPLPGDLAEIEAFCRIFRVAEQVHKAVMEALCLANNAHEPSKLMPDGYGSMSSVDARVSRDPFLEERVVSSLGCIGVLLHQQKQEMLYGRLRGRRPSPIPQDDTLPPLAQFRAEMKTCCKELEAALYRYFPLVDRQFTVMFRKLQRLRNVCFDAGCPRPEGYPSHADVPNFAAVKLWPSRGDRPLEIDNSTEFWRGGSVTEEGLSWLIKEGFKVIVDLRAENSADQFMTSALDVAISSRNFRHVKLPVDPGNSPTKDQVEQFVSLVADPGNHPLYLHSQEGVSRTSAMVARWREIAIRCAAEVQAKHADPVIHDMTNKKASLAEVDWEVEYFLHEGEHCSDADNNRSNGSSRYDPSDSNDMSVDLCKSKEKDADIDAGKEGPLERPTTVSSPFEAQRPTVDVFSKQAMSNFLKERCVMPTSCVWNWSKKVATLNLAGEDPDSLIALIAEPARKLGVDGLGIPRVGRKVDISKPNGTFDSSDVEGKAGDVNVPFVSNRIFDVSENSSAADQEERASRKNGASIPMTSENDITKGAFDRNHGVRAPLHDIDEPDIIGDMCASRTGVVRLQSRKKAEMYLVRTDGFSCTRERVKESTLAFTHPSTQQQMLMWKTAPKTVLLLKKLGNELMQEAQQVASFLHYQEGMNIVVEPEIHDHFARLPGFSFVQTFCNQDASDLHERVDFVVCLGGDGVILHASNLFRDAVPPVVSFNLGSLGFLTVHPFEDFMQDLRAIIHGNIRVEGVYITLRMRLQCEFFRNGKSIPGKTFDVLNEVVVDRGSNPYLCKIECFERNRLITKVQADGVIVATPTGSTAYSTAAGGSMVHPNVPCMLFTPICPHSLSFRPVILPDSALLELKVPEDARSNAWVSFDGKKRQQLSRGDSVRVCMSKHPLPTVNKSDQTDDWFHSLVRCLNWNERLEQRGWTASS